MLPRRRMPPVIKALLRRPALQGALGRLLGLYLAFAYRTTRWTLDGAENLAPHAAGVPVVAACWHERLAFMPMLWVLARRAPEGRASRAEFHVLASRHRDGRLIGAVVRWFGISVVQGSSSAGGPAGLRVLLRLIAQGHHIGLTPDGPRGPRRQAAAGVAQLAALSGAPVLPCSAQTSQRWVLNSWDRMVIPRPFGRGVIVCGGAIAVPRRGWQATLPSIVDALNAAAERADRLCGG